MFGQNEIVGRKAFVNEDRLLVTSMFMTLQGEGPLAGRPAFFVRLAKCNLACSFCDTYFDSGDWFTGAELERAIDRTISEFFKGAVPYWASTNTPTGSKPRYMALVITGGEPALQPALVNFLWAIKPNFNKVQIESNGTLALDLPRDVILVCSPKCFEGIGDSSGRKPMHYLKPHPDVLRRADCLKFVMESPPEGLGLVQSYIEEVSKGFNVPAHYLSPNPEGRPSPYSSIPDWAHEWRYHTGRDIFISPMNIYNQEPRRAKELRAAKGQDITLEDRSDADEVISFWEPGLLNMEANKRNHEYAAKYAIQHGFIFNVQIHLLASVA